MEMVMRLNKQSGQALVSTAVAMVVLALFAGLGIDMGMLRYQKRLQQSAADAAALAGASNLIIGGVQAGAQAAAAVNGFTDNTGGGACSDSTNTAVAAVTVTICNAPQDRTINGISVAGGPHKSDITTSSGAVAPAADYVEAIVSVVQPTYFMQIFGVTSETVIARAVATNFSGAFPGTTTGCLYTLAPPSTTGVNGVSIAGSAELDAPNCGILDNGNYDPTGKSPNLIIKVGSFDVSGTDTGSTKLPTCTATPDHCPQYGAAPTTDPMAGIQPPCNPCTGGTAYSSNSTSTVPCAGTCTYTSISFAGNGVETFSPGTYIINGPGGVSCNGTPTITGTGVTFYFTNGATWNCAGNDNINLTAPTSGTYSDVLFYQDPADTTNMSLGGNTGSTYNGIIYAPTAEITFFGNAKGNAVTLGTDIIISAAVNFFGNPTVSMGGVAGLPAPLPPSFTVGQATLVE
jgi:Flp pilus assembly protein TadG